MGKIASSPIWKFFEKLVGDPSFVICQVDKCGSKVSRGSRLPSKMTNTGTGTIDNMLITWTNQDRLAMG